jgi:hypothetical protein
LKELWRQLPHFVDGATTRFSAPISKDDELDAAVIWFAAPLVGLAVVGVFIGAKLARGSSGDVR